MEKIYWKDRQSFIFQHFKFLAFETPGHMKKYVYFFRQNEYSKTISLSPPALMIVTTYDLF